jgi:hypothetical protein
MKKRQFKKKPNKPAIKELATHFEEDLNKSLPIAIQPDGSIIYKDYRVKQIKNGNWAVFDRHNRDLVEQFFLKSSALMGAKAYAHANIEKFNNIKSLDTRYCANYMDNQVYKKNIKSAKDFDRYCILLNKLEESTAQTQHFKEEISRLFRWSFA